MSGASVPPPGQTFAVDVRDARAFLEAAIFALGAEGEMAIEGQLAGISFDDLPKVVAPAEALRRQMWRPVMDFAVVPLRPDIVQSLVKRITTGKRYGEGVLHIQLARMGVLILGAYDVDHWGPGGTWVSAEVGDTLMKRLVSQGAIGSFHRRLTAGK